MRRRCMAERISVDQRSATLDERVDVSARDTQEVAWLRAQLDCAPVTVVRLASDGRITHVNEAWRRFARDNGADAVTAEGIGLDYLQACRVADDPRATRLGEAIRDVLDGQRATVEEVYPCHSATQARWFRLTACGVNDGAVLVHADVTGQRRAVSRLRVQMAVTAALAEERPVLDACRDVMRAVCDETEWDFASVWQCPNEGRVRCVEVWARPGSGLEPFERATREAEFALGESLPGRAWARRAPQWIEDLAAEPGFARVSEARAAGLQSGFAFPLRAEGEVLALVEFFSRVRREPDAELMHLLELAGNQLGVEALRDRERKRTEAAEAELKRTQAEFAAAQRLATAGTLAAGVAHEINTPVQFVNDSLHFLRNAAKDVFTLLEKLLAVQRAAEQDKPAGELASALAGVAEAQEEIDLDYIRQNVPKAFDRCIDGLTRVATIVRSMKEFAHPAQREMAPADLNRAVRNTLTLAQNEFRYVAKLETELGELPPVVCHASDINQVVLNLVVNAAHAIADAVKGTSRKGTLTVRTWREGDRAVIAVGDTGGGIPEAIRHRVFDPFFTTKKVGQGTGQGLSLAWAIVKEKHGGELTFETKVGEGTTFFVRLPLRGKKSATEEGAA